MKVVQFEGTPEEFKAIAHLFNDAASATQEVSDTDIAESNKVSPKEAIRAMLTRIPVSRGQRAVYQALAGGHLKYEKFLDETGRTSAEMAGVLGALGGRINATKEIHEAGLPGNTKAILVWENDGYRLTKDALEVLKEEGIIDVSN